MIGLNGDLGVLANSGQFSKLPDLQVKDPGIHALPARRGDDLVAWSPVGKFESNQVYLICYRESMVNPNLLFAS